LQNPVPKSTELVNGSFAHHPHWFCTQFLHYYREQCG
jgi:hypothetical protein